MLIQRTQGSGLQHPAQVGRRHRAVMTIDGVDHLTAIPPDEMASIREVWGVPPVKVPWLRAVGRAELEGDLDAESLRAMDPTEALVPSRKIDGSVHSEPSPSSFGAPRHRTSPPATSPCCIG